MAKINVKKILKWLDNNVLFILACFLLAFIPLMPKIPVADLIPGYIVRLRTEDLVIGATLIIYVIWGWRGKIDLKFPLWKWILAYLIVGALSIISGVLLIDTIPPQLLHIGKSLLHWARYAEYFFLGFLLYSAVKTKLQVKIALWVMVGTLLFVNLYGMGQKYLYWPVYSTMNREFSKGVQLYLTPHARVQSTFAGHYDLAAYLIILLPLTIGIFLRTTDKKLKVLVVLANITGLWTLMTSGSRTSFGGFLIAMAIIFFLEATTKGKKFKEKLWWWVRYQLIYLMIVGAFTFTFGQEMIERFLHFLDGVPVFHDVYHNLNGKRKEFFDEWLPVKLGIKPPSDGVAYDNTEVASVLTPSDSRPAPLPGDVYEDIPDIIWEATVSSDGSTVYEEVYVPRTWSENADKYGLSIAIRLDTLWPNAVNGWRRNVLLGSGYGTLNKGENLDMFTEADSTDNNFLRTLGETGLLGTLLFYGMMVIATVVAIKNFKDKNWWLGSIALSYVGIIFGLAVNAVYIDVFAASKVAMTFWSLTGLLYASTKLKHDRKN